MSCGSSSQFLVFREKLVVSFHVGYSHPQIDGKVVITIKLVGIYFSIYLGMTINYVKKS